jgi:hypothetical protein
MTKAKLNRILFKPSDLNKNFRFIHDAYKDTVEHYGENSIDLACTEFFEVSGLDWVSNKSKHIGVNSMFRALRRGIKPNLQEVHIAISDRKDLDKAFYYAHSVSIWTFEDGELYSEVFINRCTSTTKHNIMPYNPEGIQYILSALSEIAGIYTEVNGMSVSYNIGDSQVYNIENEPINYDPNSPRSL